MAKNSSENGNMSIIMYKLWGKVRQHNQRGKKLGFPTANLNLSKKIQEGIYISKTKIKSTVYPSIAFIGKAKTFNEKNIHAEIYILDFKKKIYGRWISVVLFKKIRNNRKFKSANDLVKQMKKDEEIARKYFVL